MHRPRRSLAVLAIAAAITGSAATTASAAGPSPAGIAVSKDHRSSARIARHWTAARMRHATPLQIPGVKRGRPLAVSRKPPAGMPGAVEGTRGRIKRGPAGGSTRAPFGGAQASYFGVELPWSNTSYGAANPISAVGRLYFRGYDRSQNLWYDSSCTGTLIAANIVITAAHCVREGIPGGVTYNSFTFAPGVNATSRPYGTFTSRQQVTATSWFSAPYYNSRGTDGHGFFGQDYAFVVLNRNAAGQNAGDIAGTYGFYYNAPSGSVYHLGYPAEGNWNGCTTTSCKPWQCSSPIQKYDQYAYFNKYDMGFSCYTTGGASGGPNFQLINGRWYITSVLSHMGVVHFQNGGSSGPRYGLSFFGSYLDADALSIYNYARTL
jgi:V8-like Glu-specific endopeptidase